MLGRAMLTRLTEQPGTVALADGDAHPQGHLGVGLAELVPVRLEGEAARPIPIASGYVPLAALALADGWVLVRAESEGYPAGSEVVIRPWP